MSSPPPGSVEELAVGRRVAAPAVVLPQGADDLALLAQQRVGEAGLAHARRTQQTGRQACPEVAPELVEADAGEGAADDDTGAGGHGMHLGHGSGQVERDVDLVEDDDGRHPALHGQQQVALDAARIEVVVEPRDEEGEVQVGGQDLRSAVGGPTADECASPRQDLAQRRPCRLAGQGLQCQPVAHGRARLSVFRRPLPASLEDHVRRSGSGQGQQHAAAADDAAGHQPVRRVATEGRGPLGRPAEVAQGRGGLRQPRACGCPIGTHQPTLLSLPVRLA